MKNIITSLLAILTLLVPFSAYAQLNTMQGGTGTSSPSAILYGDGTLHLKSAVFSSPLNYLSGTVSCNVASGSQAGCLASADWTTFNNKVTAIGSGYATTTLPNISLSTSTQSFNGLTIAQTISSPNTQNILFTPNVSGTLNNSGLTNSSVTVNTTAPLGGGGALSLGGTLTLTCSTCTTGGITALGNFATTTGTAISISTSTLSFNGLTVGQTIAVSPNGILFTPTITGTLNNAGLTNSTISGVALGGTLSSHSPDGTTITGSAYNGSATVSNWAINLANSNQWTASTTFTKVLNLNNASSSLFTQTGSMWFPNTTNAVLGTDNNGLVNATSSIGANYITGTLGTINTSAPLGGGGSFSRGGTLTLTCTTCTTGGITALGNYATTTATTISISTSTLLFDGVTFGNTFAVSSNNIQVTPTASGNFNALSHDATLNGTSYNLSAAVSNWGLNLANANNWTGLQTFLNSTSTQLSAYQAWFGGTATSSFSTTGALTLATALTIANGGTGATTPQGALNAVAPTPTRAGDVIYYNGSNWVNFAGNNSGTNCYSENGSGVPAWAACSGAGGGAWPFTTTDSNFGSTPQQSTTTPEWFKGNGTWGLFASSTSEFDNSTTTLATFKTAVWEPSITSALISNDANGKHGAYAGSTCTNQFVRSLNGAGVATCNTVSLTLDVTGTLPIGNGGTNATSCGTTNAIWYYDGTRFVCDANFTDAASTKILTYVNASTTAVSVSGYFQLPASSNPQPTVQGQIAISTNSPYQLQYSGVAAGKTAIDPRPEIAIGMSSTTAFLGSTTNPYSGDFGSAVTLVGAYCHVVPTGSTATYEFYYTNPSAAASTPLYFALTGADQLFPITSNNTPAAGATTTNIVGNTTGSVTSASCTFLASTTPV